MIVSIIPIRRMPRGMGPFDYEVPTELEQTIAVGQLVRIPLRKSEIFGLVLSLEQTEEYKSLTNIKSILSLVQEIPLVSEAHLLYLRMLAALYGVSIGTVTSMSLLPLQKRKLSKLVLSPLPDPNKATPEKIILSQYSNTKERLAYITTELQKGITLVLVPEIRHVHELASLLSSERQEQAILWHSDLSTKEQFEAWRMMREQEGQLIIGTRGAALLPIPNIKTIILDKEEDENHKHWDQAPRFHAKDVIALRQKTDGATIHHLSNMPSVSSYFQHYKKQVVGTLDLSANADVCIINMQDERKGGNYEPLSDRVIDAITAHPDKDIAILVHRLGYARSVGCQQCGFVVTCSNCNLPQVYHEKRKTMQCHYCNTRGAVPTSCPTCHHETIDFRGVGSEQIESYLRAHLPENLSNRIVRIDREKGAPTFATENQPRILVGTKMMLPYIRWDKTAVCCIADADTVLHIPEYTAAAQVWHELHSLAYEKMDTAQLLVQTHTPDHLVFRALHEPDRFYRMDLNARMAFGYPPYTILVRYSFGHPKKNQADDVSTQLVEGLTNVLTKEEKNITLSLPFALHPGYYRGKHWYGFVARFDPVTWKKDLAWMNQYIPKQWKIDPNPISLLSP